MSKCLQRGALAAAVLFACQAHAAAPLKLLGTTVELPFEYRVLDIEHELGTSSGAMAKDRYEVEITNGPLKGEHVVVQATFWSPRAAAVLDGVVRDNAQQEAAKAGNRGVLPVQIDGFGFYFIDGPGNKAADWPERMLLDGAVSGSMYHLGVFAKDARPLTPELAKAMKAIKLDYPELLRQKARFDDEAKLAVTGSTIDTPLGRFSLGTGVHAALVSSVVSFDGNGKLIERHRSFSAFKVGFWAGMQNLVVSLGCEADKEERYVDFLRLDDPDDADKPLGKRYINATPAQPVRFMGMDGAMVEGQGPQLRAGPRPAVLRTAARKDGVMYTLAVDRLKGSPIEDGLQKQLANASPTCRTDLAFGSPPAAGGTAGAVAAPSAP